ncbi:carboxypeptidase regulatory-like domain-containing protein [bacterium]|nr:carboxypeptidase regulatory-like domain-containing protein [bacterium]
MKNTKNLIALAALTGLSLIAASCGGGGGGPVNPGGGGPAAGTADLTGTLKEGAGGRVTSTVGDGLSGIPVSLINTVTGALQGTDTTSASGNFEFKAIPSGSSYLVKVEFTSSKDLDGDGSNDQVELYFPVSVADQSITNLIQTIGVDDSNNDGSDDSLVVKTEIGDDNGHRESHHRQHRFRDGQTVDDSNNNGSFSDDSGFDDSNCDNLPDSSSSSGGSMGSGIELFGAISSIDSSSFTVNGVTFSFTSATEWHVGDRSHASPSEFPVGTEVKVEGFKAANGGFVATEVKTGQGSSDDDPGSGFHVETFGTLEALGVDGFTVGGTRFKFNAGTEWKLNGEHVSVDSFSNGMSVKVEAVPEGEGYVAIEVKSGTDSGSGGDDDDDDNSGSGGGDDNDDDDDNSGSGGDDDNDDDSNDDNGGDDDSNDDNGGDDSGTDGGGDDGTPDQGSGDN